MRVEQSPDYKELCRYAEDIGMKYPTNFLQLHYIRGLRDGHQQAPNRIREGYLLGAAVTSVITIIIVATLSIA